MDSLRLYGLVTAGAAALLGAYVLLRRKPKTASEIERERRTWLEGAGRITDGTVIDVQELAAASNHHAAIMLIYKYDVAGVSYECSQDVTYLRHWINLHSCRLGLHTSVKYDPHNPGNSLVVSEGWMGLRQ
jgi:hypothetical protein